MRIFFLACVLATLTTGCHIHVTAVHESPALRQLFSGSDIVFAARREPHGDMYVYDERGAEEEYPPCSTFKVWNTLIGLDTGVITGRDFALEWDPVRDPVRTFWPKSWQRDHTLDSAFRNSVLWFYQEVARRIGKDRMQAYIDQLDFGNRDLAGPIDHFWLESTLKISPGRQVDLLGKLIEGDVPFQPEHIAIIKELMAFDDGGSAYTLRGKTGLGHLPDGRLEGWFIGWVEVGSRKSPFALYMRADTFDEIFTQRKINALAALRELGFIP